MLLNISKNLGYVRALIGLVFIAAAGLSGIAHGDVGMPDSIQADTETLALNGQGTRKKAFISLYDAGLYLSNPSSDANAIVSADSAMAIRLVITSGLINAKKMKKAMQKGFDQSTGGNTTAISNEIDQFQNVFIDGVDKQDVFELVYRPGTGVEVSKNGVQKNTISGLPFKQALFGIWLSQDPIQESLKKALLSAN